MKKQIPIVILLLLITSNVFAADFSPTLLKLSADPIIMYEFAGDELAIPVEVSGTPAGLVFCVFTTGNADQIENTINGYLGWHQVNKIDTCIYYSTMYTMYNFDVGLNVVMWDGRDQDGNVVPTGEYTYYMWAFDNQGARQKVCDFLTPRDESFAVTELDTNGMPLANPIYYEAEKRWIIGNDPLDESLLETCSIPMEGGWSWSKNSVIHPRDFSYFFIQADNDKSQFSGLQKYKWVPNGTAELQTDFGEGGYSELFYAPGGGKSGVVTDGNYLYTADDNHVSSTEPDADFYIFDFDGFLVEEIDLTGWWSDPGALEVGAQMNGGPDNLYCRNGKVFLNCHCSCIKQMVDPLRYLESGELDDFFVWINRNGDYILDHNFEDTAALPWVCNDYNVVPYTYNISADDNLFSQCTAYDVGAVSFGLLAPDGTGLGYFKFAGETAGKKSGSFVIDGGTPFDGMYCDNTQVVWKISKSDLYGPQREKPGIYFIGHDSIKGIITSGADIFAPPDTITVISPAAGEKLVKGTEHDIKWQIVGKYYIVEYLRIEISTDGGANWSTIKDIVAASDRSYTWTVPDIESDECLIRLSDVKAWNPPGISHGMFSIVSEDVSVVKSEQPMQYSLSQNHPNPFNPVTIIPFTIPQESRVTLAIYNLAGKKVAVLADNIFLAGEHSVEWDASGFSSGVYFYKLKAGGFVETRRMTLVK